jgi:hypothetical protein
MYGSAGARPPPNAMGAPRPVMSMPAPYGVPAPRMGALGGYGNPPRPAYAPRGYAPQQTAYAPQNYAQRPQQRGYAPHPSGVLLPTSPRGGVVPRAPRPSSAMFGAPIAQPPDPFAPPPQYGWPQSPGGGV